MKGFPDSSVGKESACNVGDLGLVPGLGRSPGEGNGYPLQKPIKDFSVSYSSLFQLILLKINAAAAAKSLQSCRNLCDPIEGSPPGSTIPGILQARTLEWVAISFSNA